MAIKIIKHGENKFQAICPICGCVFEYGLEDLTLYQDGRKGVKCPDCNEVIYKEHIKPISNYPLFDNAILTTREENGRITFTQSKQEDPCETCPNKDGPKDAFGYPIVGDSPCQWCSHNKRKATW